MFGFAFRLIGRVITFVVRVAVFVGATAVVAGGVAYMLFDGEQYKKQLSQRVVDVTGRALAIDGKAELDLALPPRIVLNNVRIKNASWGSRPDMVRIRRMEIRLNPLAAVSGGESVSQINVAGADVLLETNPQGLGNWEAFAIGVGPAMSGVMAALGQFGLFGATPSAPPFSFSDTTFTFRDGATGRVQTASLGNLFEFNPGAGFPPEAAAGGSHVLAAANSDNTNPCDGNPQSDQKQADQKQAKDQGQSGTPPPPPPKPATVR